MFFIADSAGSTSSSVGPSTAAFRDLQQRIAAQVLNKFSESFVRFNTITVKAILKFEKILIIVTLLNYRLLFFIACSRMVAINFPRSSGRFK